MIYKIHKRIYDRRDFKQIAPKIVSYIEKLEKRFLVTKSLLQESQKPMILSAEDLDLVENPLPIILCYTQHHYLCIVSAVTQEYRTQKPLKLGKDIQIIATDSEANMKRLKAYSDRHQLNLNIILFADLENLHCPLK